jgi:hypothetical protein
MELLHSELERAMAEERSRSLARRRFAQDASPQEVHPSNASLTSLSASSLCSRRTAVYETESRPRPRAAA